MNTVTFVYPKLTSCVCDATSSLADYFSCSCKGDSTKVKRTYNYDELSEVSKMFHIIMTPLPSICHLKK